MDPFPQEIGGIRVLALGCINPSTNFHNAINIMPPGYACEIVIASKTDKGAKTKQTITCEIRAVEGCPEYCITNKDNGVTYWSSTEAGVWRKFESGSSLAGSFFMPSFFNLEVEQVIEGMDGALDCEEYKFHVERGYPSAYRTPEQAYTAKTAFLAKWEREKRTRARQEQRHTTPEEAYRRDAYARKRAIEEKEMAKELAALEKAKKDREREEDRRRKDKSREDARDRKEEERRTEAETRERKREEEKAQKVCRAQVNFSMPVIDRIYRNDKS